MFQHLWRHLSFAHRSFAVQHGMNKWLELGRLNMARHNRDGREGFSICIHKWMKDDGSVIRCGECCLNANCAPQLQLQLHHEHLYNHHISLELTGHKEQISETCGCQTALLMAFLTKLASTERQHSASDKAEETVPVLTDNLDVLLGIYAFVYPLLSRDASSGQAGAIIAVSTRSDVRSLASDWTSIPENMGKRKLCHVDLKDKSSSGAVIIRNIQIQLQ